MAQAMTVGRAAQAAGLTRKAVRLYEERGLLPPAQRTAAGYRLYNQDDVDTLTFIRRARAFCAQPLQQPGRVRSLRSRTQEFRRHHLNIPVEAGNFSGKAAGSGARIQRYHRLRVGSRQGGQQGQHRKKAAHHAPQSRRGR